MQLLGDYVGVDDGQEGVGASLGGEAEQEEGDEDEFRGVADFWKVLQECAENSVQSGEYIALVHLRKGEVEKVAEGVVHEELDFIID